MKRLISLLLVLVVVLTALVSCGNKEKDYTLSIGVALTEKLASNKLTQTVATIVTDADGKIVLCRLDCVDFTAKYAEDGTLNTTAPTSKVAQGESYMMTAGSWASQGKALENYVVGKNQAEVAAIALDGGKVTDAELKASCSIDVVDMLKAIDNAFKSEYKNTFKAGAKAALTAGLNASSAVKDSSTDDSKNVKLTTDYAAVVLADGVVVAAILDTAEPELKGIVAETGATSLSYKGTKRAQGESYGAMTSGTWYVQADAYVKAAIGKTASDIATIASEGVAGCTIYAGGYKAGIEAAVAVAR